jgi:hypothetical protein
MIENFNREIIMPAPRRNRYAHKGRAPCASPRRLRLAIIVVLRFFFPQQRQNLLPLRDVG